MPLISEDKMKQKEKIKIEIDSDVYKQIKSYCTWAKINSIDSFFEKAALYIFSKDRDWKKTE
jgi:hypothetical protein